MGAEGTKIIQRLGRLCRGLSERLPRAGVRAPGTGRDFGVRCAPGPCAPAPLVLDAERPIVRSRARPNRSAGPERDDKKFREQGVRVLRIDPPEIREEKFRE